MVDVADGEEPAVGKKAAVEILSELPLMECTPMSVRCRRGRPATFQSWTRPFTPVTASTGAVGAKASEVTSGSGPHDR